MAEINQLFLEVLKKELSDLKNHNLPAEDKKLRAETILILKQAMCK